MVCGGNEVRLDYVGTPYAMSGRTWWRIDPQPIPPVDHRIYALDLLPAVTVPADPAPPADEPVRGTLRTQITTPIWLDVDDSGIAGDGIDDRPEQTEAAILSMEQLARGACRRAIGHTRDCSDMGSLQARAAAGEVLVDGESDTVAACIQESRDCGSPNAGNRQRLIEEMRAAYLSRDTATPSAVPDLDLGWTHLPAGIEE